MDRPLFIVGCPRSGTGVLHQLVRLHPEMAWITPFTNWMCGEPWFRSIPPTAAWYTEWVLHRLPDATLPPRFHGPYDGSLELSSTFETHEGHSIWNRALPHARDHWATEKDVTSTVRTYIHDVAHWHRRYHDRPRFVWKTPRNAFRLRFLHALYPEAYIIHLIRDGRAVAASILKRRRATNGLHQWWGVRPPGWQSQSVQSASPIEQAGWTWRECIEQIHTDLARFSEEHCLEVRYESFLNTPGQVLRRVFSTAALSPEAFFTAENQRQLEKVRPPQETWRMRLRDEQIERLEKTIASTLQECGYSNSVELQ